MKNILLQLIHSLFYPLLWCRRTVLEASEIWSNEDPMEFVDYLECLPPERNPRKNF